MSAKRNTKRHEGRKLAKDARLLRDWLTGRHEERNTVLAVSHGVMFEWLLCIVKLLAPRSAPLLLTCVRGIDWSTVGSSTRLIVLHEINDGITDLRTCDGLAPFDDGIEHDSVFCAGRQVLFPAQAAPTGAQPGLMSETTSKMRNEDE